MESKNKPFAPASKQIPVINSGWLDMELGQALSEATAKVLEHGKQATVTLKLQITPQNIAHGTVKIARDIAAKLQSAFADTPIYFGTPD